LPTNAGTVCLAGLVARSAYGRNSAAIACAVLAGHVFLFGASGAAFALCAFFFFENPLGIATYMADARAMQLPLVTIGDPELTIYDWNATFNSLGLLTWDTHIAAVVRALSWIGMALVPVWLVIQGQMMREAEAS
jgi:hypothetical protein